MKKNEKELSVVYGINPIVELLKAKKRRLLTIYTTKKLPKGWNIIKKQPTMAEARIEHVSKEALAKLAGTSDHQGFVCVATKFVFRKKTFDPDKHPFLVFLDGIQDPRNLGAILRTCFCTGVDGVIVPQKSSSDITPTALKVSAGLAEHLEIYRPTSSLVAVQELKKLGYNLYAGVLSKDSKDLRQVDYKEPLCVVIGSEGDGISSAVSDKSFHVKLPQKTDDVSYNASVAAGLFLFYISTNKNRI